MSDNDQIKRLQQQLRSAQGRLRNQQNAIQETNMLTSITHTVTYTPADGAPASATLLAGNTCVDAYIGVIAPADFTRHWSRQLPNEFGRVVAKYAFVCDITAGKHCDIAVDPRCLSPCRQPDDAQLKNAARFTDGEIVIPKGTTARVVFSLNGRQSPLPDLKRIHQRRLRSGTLVGQLNQTTPEQFVRARHSRRSVTHWFTEVQNDSVTPVCPSFCLTLLDDTLDIGPFRHATQQPYNVASVKWCSLHYLPM
jgi:hypothetical protein